MWFSDRKNQHHQERYKTWELVTPLKSTESKPLWVRPSDLGAKEPPGDSDACWNLHHQPNKGLPWWLRQWRICLQCGRPGFDPWVEKIPRRKAWQPTWVFFPGWTEEPGRPQSMGLQRVGHDWAIKHTHTLIKSKPDSELQPSGFQKIKEQKPNNP